MPKYKPLSNDVLIWLQFPKLVIQASLWQELSELHGKLDDNRDYLHRPDEMLLEALANFFSQTGQGGLGRHSEGREMDRSVMEIDCIPRMQEMVAAAPYLGQFPSDEVPIPSSHPALHASVALLLMYRTWLKSQD